ncbi:MAG TPA: BolA family protein [Burkholderiales bacterium]
MNTHADRGPAVAREIETRLAALEPLHLEVIDDSSKHAGHVGARPWGGTHWRVAIVSPRFAGVGTVARHRLVYAALGELMQDPIHALAITARAPDEAGAAPRSDTGEHRS